MKKGLFGISSLFLWVLFLFCGTIIHGQGDACRALEFAPPKDGHALINHVIRSITLYRQDSCRIACYFEDDCLSYNFGRSENEHFVCQLSDSDDVQHPNDLKKVDGFTYVGTENACRSNLCSRDHGKCAIRPTANTYYCKCYPGYSGKYCQDKIYRNCAAAPNESGIYNIQLSGVSGSFLVYCDQASHGGGWTMVFKVLENATSSKMYIHQLWNSSDTYSENVTAALNATATHLGHYKNRLILKENWKTFHPRKALVVLYEKGQELRYLKFNASSEDNISWFSQHTLVSSSWNDLETTNSFRQFAIKGDAAAQRSFEIIKTYDSCPKDVGWLVITRSKSACSWEKRRPHPNIIYSKENSR